MDRVNHRDALAAWVKWATVIGCPTDADSLYKFSEFIGDPCKGERRYIINIENPEIVKRIILINGPNGHALLKMWIAQNGE